MSRIRILLAGLVCFALVLASAGTANAQVPNQVNYQGLLLDSTGAPINGDQVLTLRVWDDATSDLPASLMYEEIHPSVPVTDGVFDLSIGAGAPTANGLFSVLDEQVFEGPSRWLEVQVGAETLSPRQSFRSVAYALQCQTAAYATTVIGSSIDSSSIADGSIFPEMPTVNPVVGTFMIGERAVDMIRARNS